MFFISTAFHWSTKKLRKIVLKQHAHVRQSEQCARRARVARTIEEITTEGHGKKFFRAFRG
jgi:hypothetical protein